MFPALELHSELRHCLGKTSGYRVSVDHSICDVHRLDVDPPTAEAPSGLGAANLLQLCSQKCGIASTPSDGIEESTTRFHEVFEFFIGLFEGKSIEVEVRLFDPSQIGNEGGNHFPFWKLHEEGTSPRDFSRQNVPGYGADLDDVLGRLIHFEVEGEDDHSAPTLVRTIPANIRITPNVALQDSLTLYK